MTGRPTDKFKITLDVDVKAALKEASTATGKSMGELVADALVIMSQRDRYLASLQRVRKNGRRKANPAGPVVAFNQFALDKQAMLTDVETLRTHIVTWPTLVLERKG